MKHSELDSYDRKLNAIEDKVAAAVQASGQRLYVDYSAYESDNNDDPMDNLDEIPVQGKIRLVQERDECWGGPGSKTYRSDVLESPTWLQITVCANKMIKVTRDRHHVFLEGIDKLSNQTEDNVTLYRFLMGS